MAAFEYIFATLMLVLVADVSCFPGGAPSSACPGLAPSSASGAHRVGPQPENTLPYILGGFNVTFAAGGYVPGMTYRFNVTSMDGQTAFSGVLLQGRSTIDNSVLGTFNDIDSDTRQSSCATPESGITHNSRSDKLSVDVEWVAPPEGSGPVAIGWAVVQQLEMYWANLRSDTLVELPAPTIATTEAPTMDPEATTTIGTGTTAETTDAVAAGSAVTASGTTFSVGLVELLAGLIIATIAVII